jgi:hypothetical protein
MRQSHQNAMLPYALGRANSRAGQAATAEVLAHVCILYYLICRIPLDMLL